jgi:hypothetical protein
LLSLLVTSPHEDAVAKDSKPEPIIAKISQETLAEMIGTTRSRVRFFMNKFRELGFINYNGSTDGGIEVHSSLTITDICSCDVDVRATCVAPNYG